jgi:hypothetical protein
MFGLLCDGHLSNVSSQQRVLGTCTQGNGKLRLLVAVPIIFLKPRKLQENALTWECVKGHFMHDGTSKGETQGRECEAAARAKKQ